MSRSLLNTPRLLARAAPALLGLLPALAFGDSLGGGEPLPWEGPLEAIARSLTGPVALSVTTVGLIAAGFALIWGGEISDFLRRLIMLVFVIGLIMFTSTLIQTLFSDGETVPAALAAPPVPPSEPAPPAGPASSAEPPR